jgi:hypothetical protein
VNHRAMHGSTGPVLLGILATAAVVVVWRLRRRSQAASLGRQPRLVWPEQGVAVFPSTVAGAGDGLFAMREFGEGEVLAEYYGEVLSFGKLALRENRDSIMGGFGLNAYVDAVSARDCAGRYVNDSFEAHRRNARFRKEPSTCRAVVVAIRTIRAGEEILASCTLAPLVLRPRAAPFLNALPSADPWCGGGVAACARSQTARTIGSSEALTLVPERRQSWTRRPGRAYDCSRRCGSVLGHALRAWVRKLVVLS